MQGENKSKAQLIEELSHLQQMEALTDAALNAQVDTFFIFDPVSGKAIRWNKAFREVTGYSDEEISRLSAPISYYSPQDIERASAFIQTLLTDDKGTIELELICKNGRKVPTEYRVSIIADEVGKPGYFISVGRDISERKEAEKKLLETQQQYDEAEQVAHLGHWALDLVKNELTWSNENYRIFGLEPGTGNTYETFLQTVHPDDRELVDHAYTNSVQNRTAYDIEHKLLMTDGSIKWVHERCNTHYAEDGTPLRSLGTALDITEYKKMEHQFLQAQKMEAVGTLVGGIAHDFNNMLAAIQGNIYLSKRMLEDQPEIRGKLNNVEQLANRAADMVGQLLTFARKDVIRMKQFSLNAFIKEGMKLAKSAIPGNIEHSCDICREDLVVDGDATQLQQVLMNLLNNAAYAVKETADPRISCSLSHYEATAEFIKTHPKMHDRHFAKLEVRDNGCGITKNYLDKIFEPFFTTKDVGQGTGLGLAMVYGAIQSHHGTIEAESEAGTGTVFKLYLPLVKERKHQAEKTAAEVHGQGETILLVDDDADMLSITAEVLDSLGYIVVVANDGGEAIEIFKSQQNVIDLIVTDMVMPKMGGVDLAKSIRQLHHHIPIIFATGYDKDKVFSSLDHIEHSGIIGKPFLFSELSQLIQRLIYSDSQHL